MRKALVVAVLLLAGAVDAVFSGWLGYTINELTGNTYQVFGPCGLTVLSLGFVGGIGAPLLWSLMGVGFGNAECTNGCTELERWCHAVFIGAALGLLLGISVFAVENPQVSPISPIVIPYIVVLVIVAEGAMVLGRGANWLLGRVA